MIKLILRFALDRETEGKEERLASFFALIFDARSLGKAKLHIRTKHKTNKWSVFREAMLLMVLLGVPKQDARLDTVLLNTLF